MSIFSAWGDCSASALRSLPEARFPGGGVGTSVGCGGWSWRGSSECRCAGGVGRGILFLYIICTVLTATSSHDSHLDYGSGTFTMLNFLRAKASWDRPGPYIAQVDSSPAPE
uniref:Uncharacterized protein n=1 Tax=Oryza rufipogon TaxID=4529 RepID=A0A0E0NDG7_ORYRU